MSFDGTVAGFLNDILGTGPAGSLFTVLSRLGDWAAVWLLLCAVILVRGRADEESHRIVVLTIAAIVAAEAVTAGLKILVARPRPADVLDGIRVLAPAGGYSFPSAHTTRSFAAATVLGTRLRRGRWALFAVATLIGLSRVVVGVHFPIDVIAGAGLGLLIGWLCVRIGAPRRDSGGR